MNLLMNLLEKCVIPVRTNKPVLKYVRVTKNEIGYFIYIIMIMDKDYLQRE